MEYKDDVEMMDKTTDEITSEDDLFINSVLEYRVILKPYDLNGGFNEREYILKKIKLAVENKCIKDGFILPNSVELKTYSTPIVDKGNLIYTALYSCKICYPVEDMIIECICHSKSRAGIHAFYEYITELDEKINIIEIFINHDDKSNELIDKINEKDKIKIRIIGVRFVLNDPLISVIAELIR